MKYLLITVLLLLSCDIYDETSEDTEYKQVYYDCYYVSQEKFKVISRIDYPALKVEDMCNQDSTFLPDQGDEICLKACVDAFNHYK